ncbi:hypothetical protein BDY19DRAFT_939669 [Irpex rosettiformis]|uniref:Uncharacterized protein n=1 Tax=Irpex rosettiformis TaxID=378272 RepID=A0ACB8U7I5_9APHY|nr:hypothetical protein BDY19DRAFT_939669 [Irpex rosettiformis]
MEDNRSVTTVTSAGRDASPVSLVMQSFPEFDHRGTIVKPFDVEGKRDSEFQDKLSKMVIELMLDFHAWSTSRPVHETETTADALEKEVNVIMEIEKEQEKTRQRLNEFVNRIKMALAALTGL